ncbi:MAG: VanZ family protein [Burkholderiaceae bacterium]
MSRLIDFLVRPSKALRVAALLAAILLFGLLFVLGIASAGRGWLPGNTDKLAHFSYYFAIAASVWIAVGGRRWRAALWALIAVALIGMLDETVQMWTPGRTPSVYDWLADVAGAACAVLLLGRLRALAVRRSRPTDISEHSQTASRII